MKMQYAKYDENGNLIEVDGNELVLWWYDYHGEWLDVDRFIQVKEQLEKEGVKVVVPDREKQETVLKVMFEPFLDKMEV